MARARVRRVRQLGPAAPHERAPPCPFRRRRPLNGRCPLSLLTSGQFGPRVRPTLLRGAAQDNALPSLSFVPMPLVSWAVMFFPASRFALPCHRRFQSRRCGSHRRFRIRSLRRLRRPWPVATCHPRRNVDAGTPAATPTGRHCARQGSCSRLSRRRPSFCRPHRRRCSRRHRPVRHPCRAVDVPAASSATRGPNGRCVFFTFFTFWGVGRYTFYYQP